eukprot:6316215-Amphidinium_carterae.3
MPQGSCKALQVWARLAALLGRVLQSLYDPSEARLQLYVDDPLLTIRGADGDLNPPLIYTNTSSFMLYAA